jgi:hypothetical protein
MTYQIKSNWHWLKRILLLLLSYNVASIIWKYDIGMSMVAFIWTYLIGWLISNAIIHLVSKK